MKKISFAILSAVLLIMLTACGATNTADSSTNAPAATATPGSEAKHTVYPLKETDASGKEITIEKAPEKIVWTSPSETEILFALGLADRIVGVSDYDNLSEGSRGQGQGRRRRRAQYGSDSSRSIGSGRDLEFRLSKRRSTICVRSG